MKYNLNWLKEKYRGRHTCRLQYNKREEVFVKEWQKLLYMPIETQDLVDCVLLNKFNNRYIEGYCTKTEREAVNTIIQWLGSEVGFDWLESTIKKAKRENKP